MPLTLFERDKTGSICARSFWKYQNLSRKKKAVNKGTTLGPNVIPLFVRFVAGMAPTQSQIYEFIDPTK